jgi:sodium/hydrogen exchanger-like protein 6/7
LVALSAYICYFFSNGIQMSGIVSLLFCGITLKHYAYHTMSRRTQRTTKYIFSTLAQLSENFIFIYLGMALFTSPPTSEKVTSYVKPLFITITTVAVIFTRYASVFPLSEGINFFHRHARGQRHEELPHSYQMMLFWAGLRGAVGVALAAGFKGNNAQTLRTTVLVVVVLTVLIFGGTTARMLEIVGIRTGVEDEAASSSDEDEGPRTSWFQPNRNGGRWVAYADDEELPQDFRRAGAARIGSHYAPYNHHGQPSTVFNTNRIFSAASSESFDSDGGEVLPLASASAADASSPRPGHPPQEGDQRGAHGRVKEDGKWFQALDQRYLLPIFSNATASRTFHARRARRSASGLGGVVAGSRDETPAGSEDEAEEAHEVDLGRAGPSNGARDYPPIPVDDSRMERGLGSPILRSMSSDGQSRGDRMS